MRKTPVSIRELRSGSGPPLVLLHGFLGSSLDFEPLVDSADFIGRTVLAVDLPGHGQAGDFPGEWGFEDVVDALLEQLPDELDLLGYSMGGRVALYLTGMHPARVRSLALIGAHPGIEHPQDRRDRVELDNARAALLVEAPEVFIDEWANQEIFGPSTSDAWRSVRDRRIAGAAERGYSWSRALVSLSTGRQVMLWNVPYLTATRTLYLVGSRDEKYVEIAREMVAQNPDALEMAIIVNSHHAPHLDRPDRVASRLAKFWA